MDAQVILIWILVLSLFGALFYFLFARHKGQIDYKVPNMRGRSLLKCNQIGGYGEVAHVRKLNDDSSEFAFTNGSRLILKHSLIVPENNLQCFAGNKNPKWIYMEESDGRNAKFSFGNGSKKGYEEEIEMLKGGIDEAESRSFIAEERAQLEADRAIGRAKELVKSRQEQAK